MQTTAVIDHDASAQPPAARRQRFIALQEQQLRRYGVRAESRFVSIARPPLRVHVLDAGSGEPVLYLHGGDGEAVDWAPLVAELQGELRLIGADRPGFGLSDPFDYTSVDLRRHAGDFVVSLLDALGLEQATVMGGSMGGFFTLCAAIDHPRRVKRAVLIGMAVGLSREAGPELRKLCTTPGATRAFMQQAASLEAQRHQYQVMFGVDVDRIPESYLATRLAGLTLPGSQDTWALLLTRLVDQDGFRPEYYLGEDLARITAPVLTLWGERDMAAAAFGASGAARIARSSFVTMPGVGHFPFLEAPQRTARAIREFFAQHP